MRKPAWLLVAIMLLALPARATSLFPSADRLLEAARTGEPLLVDLGALGARSIELWRNPLLAPGVRTTLAGADGMMHDVPAPDVETLAGRVVGDGSSVVRLTVAESWVGGSITTGEGHVSIVGRDVVPARADVSSVPVHDIVLDPGKDHGSVPVSLFGTGNCTLPCGTLTAHVILDGDDTFRGIDPGTCFARQLETLNEVDGMIYALAETNIRFEVTQQNCWTSNDVLGGALTPPETYLENLRAVWAGQGADRSTILHATGFDMLASTVGIAWMPGVCPRLEPATRAIPSRCTYGQAIYQAVPTSGYAATPFLRAKVAAHEIGHNFNADHEPSGCTGAGSIMCAAVQTAGPNTFSADSASVIREHAEATIGFIACPVGREGQLASSNC